MLVIRKKSYLCGQNGNQAADVALMQGNTSESLELYLQL